MLLSHILTCLQYELLSGSVTGTGVIVPAFEFRGTKSTVRRRNPVRLLFPFSSTILPSLPGAEDRRCSRGAMVSEEMPAPPSFREDRGRILNRSSDEQLEESRRGTAHSVLCNGDQLAFARHLRSDEGAPPSRETRGNSIEMRRNYPVGSRTAGRRKFVYMIGAIMMSTAKVRTSQAFLHTSCSSPALSYRASPHAGTHISQKARWRRTGTSFTSPAPAPVRSTSVPTVSSSSGRRRTTQRTAATMALGIPAAISSVVSPEVVVASGRAVAELLSCCVLGVLAAKKGILTPTNVGGLSKIVYGIFLPSLLMVNVAKTCVSQPVASLLPIPAFAAMQIGVGLLVSTALMRLLRIDPNTEMGRETKVCAVFQNSGILPLIFLNAMFRGNPELLTRGVAYVSFYLMGWSPTFWTVGNGILTGHMDQEEGKESTTSAEISPAPESKHFLGKGAKGLASTVKSFVGGGTVKKILSPPIVGCIAGLTIGLTPPLRWLLMRPGAPLGPVWAAFTNLTAAYTPSGVLVLAGSLANCPPGKWFTRDTKKTVLAVGFSRWLLLPAVTSGLLLAGVRSNLVPRDPMLLFVLLMESAMPSAQNSVIMLQVAGMQDAAGRCARMLCTIYLISIVPVSILLTIFISALKLA